MTRTDAVRLNDVLDSIILIEGYTAGMTVQQFESVLCDDIVQLSGTST